jgi:WD40 repeat protein
MRTLWGMLLFLSCASLAASDTPKALSCEALLSQKAALELVKKISHVYSALIEKAQLSNVLGSAEIEYLIKHDFFSLPAFGPSERKSFNDALNSLRTYAIENRVMGPLLFEEIAQTLLSKLRAQESENAKLTKTLEKRLRFTKVLSFDNSEPSSKFTLSPDQNYATSLSDDGTDTLLVWDTQTRQVTRRLMAPNGAHSRVLFSPDNRYLYQLRLRDNLEIADVASGQSITSISFNRRLTGLISAKLNPDNARLIRDSLTSAKVSPDGKTIFTGSFFGNLYERKFPSGKILHRLESNTAKGPNGAKGALVNEIALTADGQTMLTTYHTREVWIWSLATKTVLHKLSPQSDWIPQISVPARSSEVALITASHNAHVIDLRTGQTTVMIPLERGAKAVLSSDAKLILTFDPSSENPEKLVWDAKTGKSLGGFDYQNRLQIKRLEFSQDGAHVYIWDKNENLFRTETKELLADYL